MSVMFANYSPFYATGFGRWQYFAYFGGACGWGLC